MVIRAGSWEPSMLRRALFHPVPLGVSPVMKPFPVSGWNISKCTFWCHLFALAISASSELSSVSSPEAPLSSPCFGQGGTSPGCP